MLHIWTDLCRTAERSRRPSGREFERSTGSALSEIGADYLERTRPFRSTDRPSFVDSGQQLDLCRTDSTECCPMQRSSMRDEHPMACGFSNFKQHYAGALHLLQSSMIGSSYADISG